METKKKNISAEAEKADPQPDGKKPIKVIRIENVSASVFRRIHEIDGTPRHFYSVGYSRSYFDKSNKRRYINSFNLDDLGKVVSVSQQAHDYIHGLLEPEVN